MGASRKPGLGRGLSALMDDIRSPAPSGATTIPIAAILANSLQPRRRFDPEALAELTRSVAARGVLQPILVRPLGDGRYEIVAGERRWRAAQAAQLHDIPALVRDIAPGEALEVAIVENIQRADLDPIEEADSYRRLANEFGHTQEAIGRLVGKSRSHVANLMRLLDLPPPVREHLIAGRLTMGHARAILGARDPAALAEQVVARGMTVRATEARAGTSGGDARARKPRPERDADIAALEKRLGDTLGLKVRIDYDTPGGTVTVEYASLDQLDMLCQRLSGGRV